MQPGSDAAVPPPGHAGWPGRATRALIDLDIIRANVTALRRHVGGRELMAVVKANGYGHGATMVARAAIEGGATRLGVYCVEEGVALRAAGCDAPILVFGPLEEGEARDVVAARLTPTIHNLEAAAHLAREAAGQTVPFHLKIDTGLTRAGIPPEEAVHFAQELARYSCLQPEGVYTHFASADEPSKEPTWKQLRLFHETVHRLEGAGSIFRLKHTANTAATLDCPPTWLDMVRCGIGMYGYYPSDTASRSARLRPALRLRTAVSRVRSVPAGAEVGYGHEFRCGRDSTIALAPVGYGDGLPRTLGNGTGRVIVRNALAPIVGRISMDQITLDVTDVPGVAVGDEVTLVGSQGDVSQTADDLAAQAGTISYDILTAILPRVPRLYCTGEDLVAVARFERGLELCAEPIRSCAMAHLQQER